MAEGAERSNHKPDNIKSSPLTTDWETITCRLCHFPAPSLPVWISRLSYFNEGKEYQTPLTIIQGGKRKCYALGRTVGACAPRRLYELTSAQESKAYVILCFVPLKGEKTCQWGERLET